MPGANVFRRLRLGRVFESKGGAARDVRTEDGRAPVLFDVADHKVGSGEMRDSWFILGIVHGVGHVADQGNVFAEMDHLPDAERTTQHTHVEVHSHEDDILDAAGFE